MRPRKERGCRRPRQRKRRRKSQYGTNNRAPRPGGIEQGHCWDGAREREREAFAWQTAFERASGADLHFWHWMQIAPARAALKHARFVCGISLSAGRSNLSFDMGANNWTRAPQSVNYSPSRKVLLPMKLLQEWWLRDFKNCHSCED